MGAVSGDCEQSKHKHEIHPCVTQAVGHEHHISGVGGGKDSKVKVTLFL